MVRIMEGKHLNIPKLKVSGRSDRRDEKAVLYVFHEKAKRRDIFYRKSLEVDLKCLEKGTIKK